MPYGRNGAPWGFGDGSTSAAEAAHSCPPRPPLPLKPPDPQAPTKRAQSADTGQKEVALQNYCAKILGLGVPAKRPGQTPERLPMTITALPRCVLSPLLAFTALQATLGAASQAHFEIARKWLDESIGGSRSPQGRWTIELLDCLKQLETPSEWQELVTKCGNLSQGIEINNALYNWKKLTLSKEEKTELLRPLEALKNTQKRTKKPAKGTKPFLNERADAEVDIEEDKVSASALDEARNTLEPAAELARAHAPIFRHRTQIDRERYVAERVHTNGWDSSDPGPFELIRRTDRSRQFWKDVRVFARNHWQEWDPSTRVSEGEWNQLVERYHRYIDEILLRSDLRALWDLWGITATLRSEAGGLECLDDLLGRLSPQQQKDISEISPLDFNYDFRFPV